MKKLPVSAVVFLLFLAPLSALSSAFTLGIGSSLIISPGEEGAFLTGYLDVGTVMGEKTSPVSFSLDFRSDVGFNASQSAVLFDFAFLTGACVDFDGNFFVDLLGSFSASVTTGDGVDYAPGVRVDIGTNTDEKGFLTVYAGMGAEYRMVRKKPVFSVSFGMKMGL